MGVWLACGHPPKLTTMSSGSYFLTIGIIIVHGRQEGTVPRTGGISIMTLSGAFPLAVLSTWPGPNRSPPHGSISRKHRGIVEYLSVPFRVGIGIDHGGPLPCRPTCSSNVIEVAESADAVPACVVARAAWCHGRLAAAAISTFYSHSGGYLGQLVGVLMYERIRVRICSHLTSTCSLYALGEGLRQSRLSGPTFFQRPSFSSFLRVLTSEETRISRAIDCAQLSL